MEDYESILLVKNEVFVYNIPPLSTNKGYKASDWKLDQPDWTGRLKLVAKGVECCVKLEDKNTGELFARCPVDKYPGVAIEAVTDSSRYFVVRLLNDDGRTAFIGMGFSDRSDSFDLNVALQDHFKWVDKSQQEETTTEDAKKAPVLDLGFKEGQTIKINVNFGKKSGGRSRPERNQGIGLLPPPPGGVKINLPPTSSETASISSDESKASNSESVAPKGATNPSGDNWIKF